MSQLQVLGTAALLLLALTAFMVFEDTRQRTRNSTYVTIASQMQYHTQRLAKAAGIAARGNQNAFAQLQDSRDEFANYLNVLQNGGFAFDVQVPAAGTTEELQAACRSSRSAGRNLARRLGDPRGAERPDRAGAEHRADPPARRRWRPWRRSSPAHGPVGHAARPGAAREPPHVHAERLGRGSAEILGSDTIDPEVPFRIGKDTNDLRELIRALESGNERMGLAAVRDPRRAPSSPS
jgi:twitching motility protein PilJ